MFVLDAAPRSFANMESLTLEMVGLDARIGLAVETEIAALTSALENSIRVEFAQHNQTGATMDSMTSWLEPDIGHISIAGGAPYVEFGTQPHMIFATNAQALHWEDSNGDHFAKSVANPGYAGDDFVERAMRDLNLTDAFVTIVGAAFGSITAHRDAAMAASGHYLNLRAYGIERQLAIDSAQSTFTQSLAGTL